MPRALPNVPLRTASFGLEDRWLFWSRVRVYPDRLELAGWSLAGRHRRHISLDRIEETDHEERRLLLDLETGERDPRPRRCRALGEPPAGPPRGA